LGAKDLITSPNKSLEGLERAVRNAGFESFAVKLPKVGTNVVIPSLSGRKCNKILSNYEEIVSSFEGEGDSPQKMLTLKIWRGWKEICEALECKDSFSEDQISDLKSKLKTWGEHYIQRYEKDQVTPYIHIVICHSISWLEMHSSISQFSQQGFEATHKWHKHIYYFSTSHDGKVGRTRSATSSIQQILQKIYRMYLMQMTSDELKTFISNNQ
jgi:hypothetical protein